MQKSLILFDIDGTLLKSETNEIPKSTIEAIFKLKEAGHELAVATGRSYVSVDERIRNLPFDTFVTMNGQYILHHEEVVHEEAIPLEVIERLLQEAKQAKTVIGLLTPTRISITELTDWVEDSFKQVSMPVPEVNVKIHEEEPVLQGWYFSEDFQTLAEKFQSELKFVPWLNFGADIVPVNGSKAEGIKKLLEHLPSTPERIIVFGDGHNDIEMLKHADIGVAMGNAPKIVKEHADFVTRSIDEDGIYYACEQLALF